MEENTLRLILLVVGVCIIAGIYLFDKFKKRPTRVIDAQPDFLTEAAEKMRYQPRQRAADEDDLDLADLGPMSARVQDDPLDQANESAFAPEPDIDLPDEPEFASTPWADSEQAAGSEVEIESTDQSQAETIDAVEPVQQPIDERPVKQADSSPQPEVIVHLGVRAMAGSMIQGRDLLPILTDLGLEYGEMGIFHYTDQESGRDQAVLFHLVNMVEPGTFPIGKMDQFETPGVSLFLQANQVREPVEVFNRMLLTAESLADRLAAEVLGANREPLTAAELESTYQRLESCAQVSV